MTRRSILGKQIRSVVFRHELIIFVSPSPNVQGAMNKAAPYQHPEVMSCLSHFFKSCNDFGTEYPERFHQGKYGLQMPEAMVALIATAVS